MKRAHARQLALELSASAALHRQIDREQVQRGSKPPVA
jgi:hypothetical protein